MKPLIFNKNSIFVTLLLFLATATWATSPPIQKEFTKKIEGSYQVDANGTVDLNNKYGKVEVKTWSQNQVEIEVLITVQARDQARADETFDRIHIDMSNDHDVVKVTTTLDSKNTSTWSSWWKDSHNDDFTIDYLIHMPATNDLKLANKYGDSFVESLEDDATVVVKYGDVTMDDIGGELELGVGYGNAKIARAGDTKIMVKYGKVRMKEARDVGIESKYSKVYIDQADDVKCLSKYDSYDLGTVHHLQNNGKYDHFEIEKIERLEIVSKYTDVKVENLQQYANLSIGYGNVKVENLASNFSELLLEGKYTDYKIKTGAGMSFQLDAIVEHGKLQYPDDMEVTHQYEKYSNKEIKARRGSSGGGIKARLDYGDLKVYD